MSGLTRNIPVIGWMADVYTVESAFVVLGVTALGVSVPALWVLKRAGVS